jgi:hypoxanthine phosphoribosyltransferase
MVKQYYSYDDIHKLCCGKTQQIKSEFNPNLILAIGGGGLIPARMMRSDLKVPIYVVSLTSYDEDDKQLDTFKIIQWMDFSQIKDKRILIVDEVDDTRKTLSYIVDKLVTEENIDKSKLGVFVVHNKLKQKNSVNENLDVSYYLAGEEVEDNWIVYPWE